VGSLHVCKEVPLRCALDSLSSWCLSKARIRPVGPPDGRIQLEFGKSQRAEGPCCQPDECIHIESESLMTTIRVKENEPFDVALRRFKRTIEKLGLLTDLRAREFYEKPTAERKRKKAAAVKRHYKRVRSMQLPKKLY